MDYPVPTTILLNGAVLGVGGSWPDFDLRTRSNDVNQILRLGTDGGLFLELDAAVDNMASWAAGTGLYVATPTLDALANVATAGKNVGDVLAWDGADWADQTLSIDNLADVDITTTAPTAGQTLLWNAGNGEFEPGDIPVYTGGATNSITVAKSAADVFTANLNVDADPNNLLSVSAAGVLATANLAQLLDVDAPAPTDGQTLTWVNANNRWEPITPAAAIVYTAAGTNSITHQKSAADVFTSDLRVSAAAGQLLTVTAGGVLVTASTADLTDVSATAPTDGQVLAWNNAATEYQPVTPTVYGRADTDSIAHDISVGNVFSSALRLDVDPNNLLSVSAAGTLATATTRQLTDVQDVAATDGQWLIWSNANGRYEPGVIALGDIANVDLATAAPVPGQLLGWDGTSWIPTNAGADTHFLSVDLTGTAARSHAFGGFAHTWTNVGAFTTTTASQTHNVTGDFVVDSANGDLLFTSAANGLSLLADALNIVLDATSDLQINGDPGTAGQVLTSGGANTPPTWQAPNPPVVQLDWGYADYCDTPAGIPPITAIEAGTLTRLAIAATTAPAANETWQVSVNGIAVAETITLAATALVATLTLAVPVAVPANALITVAPTAATPGTPSTYGTVSALIEV